MKLFALVAACAAVLCAQAPLQLPITNLPPDTVVATSGEGKPITAGEIRSLLESGDQNLVGLARQNPEAFLGAIFVMRYLAAEAEKQHLADQSPAKEQLEILRSRILIQAMVNIIRETYVVSEDAINDFYAHNQSRYEQARIKVIAIGFCPVATATGTSIEEIKKAAEEAVAISGCKNQHTEQKAHDLAVGLVGKIRGGVDFVKMVAEYSEDPDSKATQGDFGLVTRENSFKQEIKDATFALRDGDVSDPIRSGNFFYIIKIKERTLRPVSEVHETIIQELKQKHFTDLMYDLQKRFKPEIVRRDFFTAKP
jgi:parvulin-like peptidyl-prolyl isomerase